MNSSLIDIAMRFDIRGAVLDIRPMGSGNINDTYLVKTEPGNPDYVLQRINNAIFKDVELLQNNIEAVTRHIRRKLEAAATEDIDRKVLTLVPLKESSRTWCCVDEKYWRMTVLIADAITPDEVTPESSYDAGLAFGKFESMLTDIPEQLGESIPDFHNMELRSRQLREAVEADAAGRMADPEVQELVAFLQGNDEEMFKAEKLYREGILPKRICHCDTKVNNMLFDKEGRFLCVIDLDTIMPGFVFSDFGDFMRTAASSLAEDDPDYEHVAFRMDIFKAFTRGYLESAGEFLTDVERDNLPYAALRFAHMQAVRFLADYINGDTYYKIAYPDHNLVRTRNQVALYKSMASHYYEMCTYIRSLSEAYVVPQPRAFGKQKIANVNWPDQFPYCPDIEFSIWHTGDALHIRYEVEEKTTKAEQTVPGQAVYFDSCVEVFIKPFADDCRYYNMEWNAAGCMELCCRKSKTDFQAAPLEIIKSVKVSPSLGTEPFPEKEVGKWSLEVEIPAGAFFCHDIKDLSGMQMSANFYKCGDALSTPHYISWKPIKTAEPDHHRTEFFGKIIFE